MRGSQTLASNHLSAYIDIPPPFVGLTLNPRQTWYWSTRQTWDWSMGPAPRHAVPE